MDGLRTLSLLVLMGQPMWAQDVNINVQTPTPTDARYQIVQSTITMRETYRLDTHSGHISRLVRSNDGWEEMIVWALPTVARATNDGLDVPLGDSEVAGLGVERYRPVQNPSKPRFQISLSGITVRGSYLIDTRTGQTWRLVKAKVDPDGPDTDANTHTVWAPLREVP